jgi:ribose transport system permease protein/AI-2 transport system permease protein
MQSYSGAISLPATAKRPASSLWRRREVIILSLLILELAVFDLVTPGFLQPGNLTTIVQNSVDLAVVSVGMTLAMIMGGIDISVGSLLGVVAIVAGRLVQAGFGVLVILPVAVLIGALVGSLNGLLVGYFRVPAIIATLGTSNIFRALVFVLLGGTWITGLPPTLDFFNGRLGGWIGWSLSLFCTCRFRTQFFNPRSKRK